uniref:TERF1-interacting nuclear factor 2 N-terminal domain-containing protein n=1 Tax=Amphilophus citrinellus TaxID=61819 RepID=A0A3Q0SBU7_AMPCI
MFCVPVAAIPAALRVVSAQVYTIVRSRDMEHFERVIGFLETTYRLLPRLVAAIKHMKIMFGLKTMTWKSALAQKLFTYFLG